MGKTPARQQSQEFASFEEFWPYYLSAHSRRDTRAMHALGTTVALLGIGSWLLSGKKKYLGMALAGSYGSAWIGHYVFEKNQPATFENPLWSLQADLRMYRLWLSGDLDGELRRLGIE
ncbi:MAG TPA: DUF962 domain-containing protein [Lacipirellulaceae bacterium]|nr:DUF962 domain-containing protein [Lacipirellulaceae bacterium]